MRMPRVCPLVAQQRTKYADRKTNHTVPAPSNDAVVPKSATLSAAITSETAIPPTANSRRATAPSIARATARVTRPANGVVGAA